MNVFDRHKPASFSLAAIGHFAIVQIFQELYRDYFINFLNVMFLLNCGVEKNNLNIVEDSRQLSYAVGFKFMFTLFRSTFKSMLHSRTESVKKGAIVSR